MSPDAFKRLVVLTVGAGALVGLAWLYQRRAAVWAEIDYLESIPVLQED